jgi:hypothetical protein
MDPRELIDSIKTCNNIIKLLYRYLFRAATLWLCISAISCSDGDTVESNLGIREPCDLNEEKYHAQMKSYENTVIMGEIGILPSDLRGWTIEQLIEKIGVPDRILDGQYGPELPDSSNIPERYRSGKIISFVYTRNLGSLFVMIHVENGHSACIQAQWLPAGNDF